MLTGLQWFIKNPCKRFQDWADEYDDHTVHMLILRRLVTDGITPKEYSPTYHKAAQPVLEI